MTNINNIVYSILYEEFLNHLNPIEAAKKSKNYDLAIKRAAEKHHAAGTVDKAVSQYINNAAVSFPSNQFAINHINTNPFPISTVINHAVATAIHGRLRKSRKDALDKLKELEKLKKQQDPNYRRTYRINRVKGFGPVSHHLKFSDQIGGKVKGGFLARHIARLGERSKFFDYLDKAGGGANRAWSDWQTGTANFFTKGRFIPRRIIDPNTGKKKFDFKMAWAPKKVAFKNSHALKGAGQTLKYLGKAFTHGLGHDFVKHTTTGARLRAYLFTKGIKMPMLGVNHGRSLFGPKFGSPIGSNNLARNASTNTNTNTNINTSSTKK